MSSCIYLKIRDEQMSINITNMGYEDVVSITQQLSRAVAIKRYGSMIKMVIE